MKLNKIFAVATLSVLVIPFAAYAQEKNCPDGPVVCTDATEQLTPHVYFIPDFSAPGVPNVGFVVGDASTLVIDTGMGVENGERVLSEALKLAPDNQLYIVSTHVHPEHDLGAPAFPADALMVRSGAQVTEIEITGMRVAEIFRSRSETNKRLLKDAAFRPADLIFSDKLTLDLGGVSAEIAAMGPGHTLGDITVFVPDENVLFSGDLAMKPMPVVTSQQSTVAFWMGTLDKLEAYAPDVIIPSHGPKGGVEFIATYREVFELVKTRAAELKSSGKTQDETVSTLTAELSGTYEGAGRLAGAIRTAYGEAN